MIWTMLDNQKYQELKTYIEELTGHKVRHRKIQALGVNPLYHGQPKRLLEIGKYYAEMEPGAPPEQIVAIFETTLFCVCTPNRGAGKGLPYFFTRESVYVVKEME
jgi:hypothetical protein